MSEASHNQQRQVRWEIEQKGTSNLQEALIPDDSNRGTVLENHNATTEDGNTTVFFRNIEDHLIHFIQQSDIVLGCVAWLTSEPILQALASLQMVSIIVQKEDFLRPDLAPNPNWAKHIRQLYNQLPGGPCRFEFEGTILPLMCYAGNPNMESIRCVGNYNATKMPAFPRSHHKFVLFCQYKDEDECDGPSRIIPEAVWTGSFNFTKTAGMSFENAILLRDPTIVQAFYQEYAQIAALSEPLDWTATWTQPEWRIGS